MFESFSSAVMEVAGDGSVVMRSAPLRYIVWLAAFSIIAPTAWYCWRKRVAAQIAAIVGITSLVVPTIVAPGIAAERIVITNHQMSLTTGFWFAPTQVAIPLDGLLSVEERLVPIQQRGADRADWFWIFHYRSRASTQLHLPDMLSSNRTPILELFRKRGIEIKKA